MERYSEPKKIVVRGKPSRYYYCRVTRDDGSRFWRSTGVGEKSAAQEVLRAWRLEVAEGKHYCRPMLFSALVAKYRAWKLPQLRPKSQYLRGWYCDKFTELLGARDCASIDREDIDGLLVAGITAGKSPVTVNDMRALMSSIFQWGCDEGYIERNPARNSMRFKAPKKAIRVLTDEEGDRLLEAASRSQLRVYLAVLIAYYSGLRKGTIAQLEWSDIDWQRREWRIPARKMKSGRDFFGVPIDERLWMHLVAHRRVAGRICGSLEPESWQTVIERAGLSDVHVHDLRRSFVTRCRRCGIDLDTTMWLSDHRDLRTVLGSYRRVDSDDGRRALALLARPVVKAEEKETV